MGQLPSFSLHVQQERALLSRAGPGLSLGSILFCFLGVLPPHSNHQLGLRWALFPGHGSWSPLTLRLWVETI